MQSKMKMQNVSSNVEVLIEIVVNDFVFFLLDDFLVYLLELDLMNWHVSDGYGKHNIQQWTSINWRI